MDTKQDICDAFEKAETAISTDMVRVELELTLPARLQTGSHSNHCRSQLVIMCELLQIVNDESYVYL
jgi:hypothetical protein